MTYGDGIWAIDAKLLNKFTWKTAGEKPLASFARRGMLRPRDISSRPVLPV